MKGKRRLIYRVLKTTCLLRVAQATGFTRWAGWEQRLLVLAYHRIGNASKIGFDDGVFSATAEGLRQQMKWLRENSQLLSESDLLDLLRAGRKIPRRAAMVTFDDGYRDNYTLAAPILKEFGIPAIFFIPTLAIDGREVGWWDQIAFALKKATEREDSGELQEAIRFQQRKYAGLPSEEAQRHLNRLFSDLGVARPDPSVQSEELMSWEEIRECRSKGISIGSHTHSHRILSRLPLSEQKRDLIESKRILEERLGAPVRSIAYPVGGYEHFNHETPALARECGFELGFSFRTGKNASLEPFDIRRYAAPTDVTEMSALLELPDLLAPRACQLAQALPAAR